MSRGIPPALAESSLIRGLGVDAAMVRGCDMQRTGGCLPGESETGQVVVEESDVRRMLGVELDMPQKLPVCWKSWNSNAKSRVNKVQVTVPDFGWISAKD